MTWKACLYLPCWVLLGSIPTYSTPFPPPLTTPPLPSLPSPIPSPSPLLLPLSPVGAALADLLISEGASQHLREDGRAAVHLEALVQTVHEAVEKLKRIVLLSKVDPLTPQPASNTGQGHRTHIYTCAYMCIYVYVHIYMYMSSIHAHIQVLHVYNYMYAWKSSA